ncbi:MAG: formyltransferase family protein, partial [Bacteroidota bacterium]
MKILFLCSGFNGLTQRAWLALDRLDHQVMIAATEDPLEMERAVDQYQPELIVATYLKARIPESIWANHTTLIVHPGIPGDRGAASLDWALLRGETIWGVTILQAVDKMDAGPVWTYQLFDCPVSSKACLYRHEVTQAATEALLEAVICFQRGNYLPVHPGNLELEKLGRFNRKPTRTELDFEWTDSAASIFLKCLSADSDPGLLIHLGDQSYLAFGAQLESQLTGTPGEILADQTGAVCIACGDGAIWFSHLREIGDQQIKLPASMILRDQLEDIVELDFDPFGEQDQSDFKDIYCKMEDDIAFIHFEVYNGAMGADVCYRLRDVIREAKQRGANMLVLMGGQD